MPWLSLLTSPAIKVLYLSGLNDVLRLAKDFGISTLSTADRYGLTLVLGGGEVTLLEMASAYGVFANEGVRVPHNSILSIKTKNGATLEEAVYESYQVISRDVALEISDILSDDAARAPIFGANSYLNIAGKDVAVKTGTTNDYKDAWIVGYSPDIVLGAWVGNNDNTPMDRKVAGYIVAPFWNKVMRKALENYPNSQFATPSFTNLTDIKPILRGVWKGSEIYTLDSISEKLATEYTPPETQKEVSVGEIHTILHYINKKRSIRSRTE
jgi:membrane peptidoglycan carboxypeptidase